MTKKVQAHRKDWSEKLQEALWAYRITYKDSIGFTPYQLVYGKQALLPIEFQIHTFKLAAELGLDLSEAQKERIMQLNQLDEMRQAAVEHNTLIQQQRAHWHDKYIKKKQFKEGDWALLFDSKFKDFKAKFTTHWLGPYEIAEVYENGSVKLQTIDDEESSFIVNGHRLKLYNKHVNKEDFLQQISQQNEMEVLERQKHVSPSHSP